MKDSDKTVTTKMLGSFVNSNGQVYAIEGLSPLKPQKLRQGLEDEWARDGKAIPDEPTPPNYTVTNAAGETSELPHDETTLETDADKVAWAAYLDKKAQYEAVLNEFEGIYNERLLRSAAMCVQVDPKKMSEWAEDATFEGITIPESRAERKYLYVQTEVYKSTFDIADLMITVMRLSGLADERMAESTEAAFRTAMAEAFASPANIPTEDTAG